MRDFSFKKTDLPSMAEFNRRFFDIGGALNGLGNEHIWARSDGGYVNSPDINAYPPAVDDGYTYEYLGQLGEKTRIATGRYTGTGKYGSSNPCKLTFDFTPLLVFVVQKDGMGGRVSIFVQGTAKTSVLRGTTTRYLPTTWSGASLSWYTTETSAAEGPPWQLNASGTQYSYVVIG